MKPAGKMLELMSYVKVYVTQECGWSWLLVDIVSWMSHCKISQFLCVVTISLRVITSVLPHLLNKRGNMLSGVTLPFGAPLLIFCRPHKFFTVSKKKKKKKKVATFFSVFLIGFFPPAAFCTPKYFFRVDRTLSWPTYGTFCYFVTTFFVFKNCKFANMPPP